ncbi:hypothetical protein E1301_Tti019004 [Triplophysa tibetana]|uniref:CCHC-type domain-containing protein n=1 Tax=Triplophysa tibetana TaxID=1572043 RepID=A0A5A9PT34_9TELE|nr:hypothetical protein E1301_Tti019004 [Triplophysa tibetana]
MHLVTFDDSIGLEKLIQYAIRIAQRRTACSLAESTAHPTKPSFWPYYNPPDPTPMQIDSSRLSQEERARRMSNRLCLYCGGPGHLIGECIVRPPQPAWSTICSPRVSTELSLLAVMVISPLHSVPAQALVDSGAAGNFICHSLLNQLQLPQGSSVDSGLVCPWLQTHQPNINWKTGEVLNWSEVCKNQLPSETSKLPMISD